MDVDFLFKFSPVTTATENEVRVTFPSGYAVDTTATNITTSTAGLTSWDSACTNAVPTLGAQASGVSGNQIDFAAGEMAVGTTYCFIITAGVDNPATPGNYTINMQTLSGTNSVVDENTFSLPIVDDDEVVISASVAAFVTCDVTTTTGSDNAINLGTLNYGSVSTSSDDIQVTGGTNAAGGMNFYYRSSNAAGDPGAGLYNAAYLLDAPSAEDTISATTLDCTATDPCYGIYHQAPAGSNLHLDPATGTNTYIGYFNGGSTYFGTSGLGAVFHSNGTISVGTTNSFGTMTMDSAGDGISVFRNVDNVVSIQAYIDGHWLDRTTYAGGCCNKLVLQPDIGQVGIGTTAPTYKLELPNSGTNSVGQARANAWHTYSDARYKTNVTPMTGMLDKVLQLQGVGFNWVMDGSYSTGFIAQSVEAIFPELVGTDNDGYKSLDYGRFAPYLAQAIKEQQKLINDLKNQAERFGSSDSLSKGDIVKLDLENNTTNMKVKKTTSTHEQALGIVLETPLENLSYLTNNTYSIALSGIISVKVSDQNGLIQRGDYITLSNQPGRGMKANDGDSTIGIALEKQINSNDVIKVLINRERKVSIPQSLTDRLSALENELLLLNQVNQSSSAPATNQEVGTVEIQVNENMTEVRLPGLSHDSVVIITPRTAIGEGLTYWVEYDTDKFIVKLSSAASNTIRFNYIVVN